MTTNHVIKKLSKILNWEIVPRYVTGICWVVENTDFVDNIYTFPDSPIYTLTAYCCNLIEGFDADNQKHLEIFLAFLDLKPPITTYISWDILIKYLEKNGIGEITMENVALAGCAM